MKDYIQMTVGQIVADDFSNAAVFDRYGIDFCCNGSRSLAEACERAGADIDKVVEELTRQTPQESVFADFKQWPLELLVDYIIKYHHRNIRRQGPEIERLLEKVCRVHGKAHPELYQVEKLFRASQIDLSDHLDKEEIMLFPYVYELCKAEEAHQPIAGFHCGTVEAPISVMMAEHDVEGARYRQIDQLTGGYTAPDDACGSYRLLLQRLKDFEAALHHHIHLENNIVFPWAIRLEGALKE